VSETWEGFFHCDRLARRYRDAGYLSECEADTLVSLPETLQRLFSGVEARLLHMGDVMHNGNMLVDANGKIVAILDFVESMAGDPRWETAWVDYYFSDYPFSPPHFDMRRFRAGYGADYEAKDELGRFYLLAILVFEKLLFFKPDSERGRWAISTVKRLLAELCSRARTKPPQVTT
jgi:hypothetical protein